MTRETKIGLLVGLAFIIVIGILLSDYNRIDAPGATLLNQGNDVRKGLGSTADSSRHDPDAIVMTKPAPVRPVLTNEEIHHPSSDEVSVVKTFTGHVPVVGNDESSSNNNVVIGPGSNDTTTTQQPNPTPPDLQALVHDHGTELVPVGPTNTKPNPPAASGPTQQVAGKKYTAVASDTVSKMAGRFMGGNTQANREAIQRANPSLAKNINNVVIGHVYIIPDVPGASTTAATPTTPAPAPAPVVVKPAPTTNAPVNQPVQTPTHWYVVKESDSLWKIAQEQLGDGNAVAAIKELNKDVLKGSDNIRPNMKLKLPAKPLAAAN